LGFTTIQTFTDAANCYIETQQTDLSFFGDIFGVELCTSDYALYWWDYQIGCDAVFVQLQESTFRLLSASGMM